MGSLADWDEFTQDCIRDRCKTRNGYWHNDGFKTCSHCESWQWCVAKGCRVCERSVCEKCIEKSCFLTPQIQIDHIKEYKCVQCESPAEIYCPKKQAPFCSAWCVNKHVCNANTFMVFQVCKNHWKLYMPSLLIIPMSDFDLPDT